MKIKDNGLSLEEHIEMQREIELLKSPLGESWAHLSSAEAVIQATKYQQELRKYLHDHNVKITIGGNIGTGKSTWTRIISNSVDISGVFELHAEHDHINDDLLHKFLLEPDKYCFQLQRYLIPKRLKSRERAASLSGSFIEDRTPEEDPGVFHLRFEERGYFKSGELEQLKEESIAAYRHAIPSDLMILLYCPPELSRIRVLERKRPEETKIWSLDELRNLARIYHDLPNQVRSFELHKGPILSFDMHIIDITNRINEGYVYQTILEALK